MLKIRELTTEYQKHPIGLDVKAPRFSWILESDRQEVYQESFRLVVKRQEQIVWDTGAVKSQQSVLVEYAGEKLMPSTIYEVQVTVTDNYGDTAATEAVFETGLQSFENFRAVWITGESTDAKPLVFRQRFTPKGAVKQARVYASALGIYELELNGEKAGESFFAPGWTSYHNRLQYQTYDITAEVKAENLLEMTVAPGWYSGILGFTGQSGHYGDTKAAIAQIHLEYENGVTEIFGTDGSWTYTTGKTRYSELYMGEIIDAGYQSESEKSVTVYEYPKEMLTAQESEPVRVTQRLKPVQKMLTPKGEVVLDFGQNLTGVICCRLKQPAGTAVKIRHAEVLDQDGNFYTENLRAAKSEDLFLCSGGEDTFMPRFTFHGFRYICIEGLAADWQPEDFEACVLHTDMKETGSFSCSHEGVSKLQKNIQWGQRGNFLDIPTDCPQRDERLGWTGDAQVFARTASFNYNTALFFAKWLRDLKSEQSAEYGVPHVIPNILGDQEGAAGWSDAAVIIPWTMYQVYGDKRILAEQFESMKGWVAYIRSKTGANGLWQQGYQYGDWVALDKEESSDRVGATDVYLIANAFYAYSAKIVAQAAELLGMEADAAEYTALHADIVEKFNEEYITATGRLVSETQTGCVLSLHFNLAKEEYRGRIKEALLHNLANHNNHLVTGFLGTPYLCPALTEIGAHDIAGKILLKEDYPSWLYAVNMGGTTIWERWNSMKPDGSFDESGMNSFNHYANGSIGDWMYQQLGGLQILEPGYRKVRIAPQFIPGITWADCEIDTVYGMLSCKWKCGDGKITVDIRIPVNTTAVVVLPEQDTERILGSGCYRYEYATDTVLEIDKYTMETTLREVLEQPAAVSMLEQMSPGMTQNEMIKFAYEMSIMEMSAMMPPEGIQMFEAVLQMLNRKS